MSRSCLEVSITVLLLLALRLRPGDATPTVEELLSQRHLLQAELSHLYLEQPPRPETQLLIDDLQLRDQELRLQVESLEQPPGKRLAINLTADFEHLQRKLDDLKHQLELLDGRFAGQNHNLGKQMETEHTPPPAPAAPAPGLGSFLWGPLLTMPEFPQGNVASDHQHTHQHIHHQQHDPPHQEPQPEQQGSSGGSSIIKRVLDMLRPSVGVTSLRSRWAEAGSGGSGILSLGKAASAASTKPLSAEELLPQLQEQRRFLDDAITRLELLAAKNKFKKT